MTELKGVNKISQYGVIEDETPIGNNMLLCPRFITSKQELYKMRFKQSNPGRLNKNFLFFRIYYLIIYRSQSA